MTVDSAATTGEHHATPFASPTPVPSVTVDGVPFSALTEAEVIDHVMTEVRTGRGGVLLTPNVDILRQLRRPENADIIDLADLVVADGAPVIWASHLLKAPLPERVTGSSLVRTLSDAAALEHRSIFLLGGNPGVAEMGARRLATVPGLGVAGHLCPEWGFEHDPAQMADIVEQVRAAQPELVYVGLGFPKQERLIQELRAAVPSAWFLGCGGGLAFLAGEVSRAPGWMQKAGLEWLHRMAKEPRRMARRYLVDDIPYALALLWRSTLEGRRATTEGVAPAAPKARRAPRHERDAA